MENGVNGETGARVVRHVVQVYRSDTGDVTVLAGGTEGDTAEGKR